MVNPLDAFAMLVGIPAALTWWLTGLLRRAALKVELRPAERFAGRSLAVLVLAANWIYVLITQR